MSTLKHSAPFCAFAHIVSFAGQLIGAARLVVAAVAILVALTGGLVLIALAAIGLVAHCTNRAVDRLLSKVGPFARTQQRIALRRFD
jgi:hypothetical protein